MRIFQWRTKSIGSFFLTLTVILILFQIVVLLSLLISGGVFKQAKLNSYKSFNDTINNRRDYLQQEMNNRWTNLTPYLSELGVAVSTDADSVDQTLESTSETLIHMLRLTGGTGVYLVLDDPDLEDQKQPALYFRDYDPLTNSSKNDDIYVVYGPSYIANHYGLPLDASWQYNLTLTDDNKNFFEKPFNHSTDGAQSKYLGYWNEPFQLTPEDSPIITYSMPLQDINNQVIGVVGIELSVSYLTKFLPMSELQLKDSLGYVLAKKDDKTDKLHTMMTTNNIQKIFLEQSNLLALDVVDEDFKIYTLEDNQTKDHIYASFSKFSLYEYNSPFQNEEWYIVGFKKSDHLLAYFNRIVKVLLVTILILLVAGIGSAIFISRRMSKPVVSLAKQVVQADKMETLTLRPTGLLELDDLSDAIIQTNKLMLDSASRFSRIIEMVELPIGTFEVNLESDHIAVAGQLYKILAISPNDNRKLESRSEFEKLITEILLHPEQDSDHIYKLPYAKNRWVRVKSSEFENHVYGIIEDVTEEILRLKKIKRERDLDPLTKLLNRKSFQIKFEQWAKETHSGVAALAMFDLDFLKVVNDTYGHKWGDFYIIEAANRLKDIANKQQILLSRRSGDEFSMLLHGFNSKEEVLEKLENFYKQLEIDKLAFPGGKLRPIRISAGFVWIENRETHYEQLLHYADEALYYSKQHNKGYFTEHNDDHSIFFDN